MIKKPYTVLQFKIIQWRYEDIFTLSKEVDFEIDDWFTSEGGWI